MLRYLSAIGLVVTLCLPRTATAEMITLSPSTPWVMNYAEDSCDLARGFGEGDEQTFVHFYRYVPSDEFRLSLVGAKARLTKYTDAVELQFGPTEEPFEARVRSGEAEGSETGFLFLEDFSLAGPTDWNEDVRTEKLNIVEPYEIAPEREISVTEIRFISGLRSQFTLKTGSLGDPFAALRACNEELLHHWGIDVAKHRSLSRKATPIDSPERWIRYNDYPSSMLRGGFSGLVFFRLTVEPTGEVSDCSIQQALEPEEFKKATCSVMMKRARFQPALDSKGQPIRSIFASNVYFTIGR